MIKAIEQEGTSPEAKSKLAADLDDLFFVIQLFSYPGDYVAERPTIERIAETLDKFEEDVLRADFPGIRGARRAVVRFGEPIPVPKEREARDAVEKWTDLVESRVQGLLDEINAKAGQEPCQSRKAARPRRGLLAAHARTHRCRQIVRQHAGAPADHAAPEPGETTVLIGPSGCGKSTMLRLMIGLIEPDQGEVLFDGDDADAGQRAC